MSRVQALPLAGQGFANRVSLCAAWRGLRGDDLKKASGFNDIEFVHHGGFIGGAWSFETCLQMAKKSLEEHHTEQEGKKASKVEKMEEEKKNENLFDKIISKEVPAEIIFEDNLHIAFKDVNPQAPVHFLVVSKTNQTGIQDSKSGKTIGDLMVTARNIAQQ